MSKHHVSHTQSTVLHDIECLSEDDLEQAYGIEIYEDGVVWDEFEQKEFESLTEWGNYIAAKEEEDNFAHTAKIAGKWRFDDERF